MKTYIWTLPTRIFHWLLAIGFTTAYIVADFDNFENLHFAFGAFVGVLLLFRILFGLLGPRYSNFKDFPIGLKRQKEFITSYFSKTKEYAGHNPVASLILLLILFVGLLCSISGYLLYATENSVLTSGFSEDYLEESHEVLAHLFLILVALHLIGILGDILFHSKTGTFQSIFTGYKNIETKNARLNGFHKAFIVLWLLIPFYVFYWAYGLQINSDEEENGYEQHDDDDRHEHDDD